MMREEEVECQINYSTHDITKVQSLLLSSSLTLVDVLLCGRRVRDINLTADVVTHVGGFIRTDERAVTQQRTVTQTDDC